MVQVVSVAMMVTGAVGTAGLVVWVCRPIDLGASRPFEAAVPNPIGSAEHGIYDDEG